MGIIHEEVKFSTWDGTARISVIEKEKEKGTRQGCKKNPQRTGGTESHRYGPGDCGGSGKRGAERHYLYR